MKAALLSTLNSVNPLWQSRLHRSVRLLLALSEPELDEVAVEVRLSLVERYLVQHLLGGRPPTTQATCQAHFVMQQAQTALLLSTTDLAAIRAEWPAERALEPVRWDGGRHHA